MKGKYIKDKTENINGPKSKVKAHINERVHQLATETDKPYKPMSFVTVA